MKTFLFCVLAFFFGIANAQEISDLAWLNLKGPVKTMESTSSDAKTGKQVYDWEDGIYKLNPDGTLSEKTRYKKNGEMDYVESTVYTDGNAVSSAKTDINGKVIEKSSYSYDNKKSLTGKVSATPNGDKTFDLSMAYADNGNMVKKAMHTYENGKTTFEETINFTYHPGTNAIKSELHEGKVFDYEHPEKNKIFSTTLNKDLAGNITDENTTTTTTIDNKSETIKKTYTYGSLPNKALQEKATINNNVISIRDFSYDTHGNLTSEKKTHYPGKEVDKLNFTYEYDEHSNWTKLLKKIEYAGKESDQVKVVRTITYF